MRIALLAFTALLAAPALAQQPGVPAPEAAASAPQGQSAAEIADPRVNQLIVYGNDPCPQSSNEEIIVCARLPEDDRFRIPPGLRNDPNDPASQSWANRAIELSYVGRSGIGSCSPAGPGGMIGCFNQIVQQARAERAAAGDVNWARMIEEARQERMRRIGEAEVEETEAEQRTPD
jgi:hypothetical protein